MTTDIETKARELEAKVYAAGQSTAARVAVLAEAIRSMAANGYGYSHGYLDGCTDTEEAHETPGPVASKVAMTSDHAAGSVEQRLAATLSALPVKGALPSADMVYDWLLEHTDGDELELVPVTYALAQRFVEWLSGPRRVQEIERGTREAKHCELHGNQLTCAKCVEVASDPDHPMRRNEATAAEPLADWADGVFQAASIVRAEAAQHPGHSSEKLLESLADTLQKVGENYPGIDSGRLTLLLEAADGLAEACDGMHAGGAWPPSYTAFVQVDSARRAYEAERKEWRGRMGRSEARPGGGSRATMPGTRPEVPDEATDQQLIALVVGLPIDTAQTLYDRLVAAWRIGRDRSKATPASQPQCIECGAEPRHFRCLPCADKEAFEIYAMAIEQAAKVCDDGVRDERSPSGLAADIRKLKPGRPDAPAGGDK